MTMTKTCSLTLTLATLAACGTVEPLPGEELPEAADVDLDREDADDEGRPVDDAADPAAPAIAVEDPRAATTPLALANVSFSTRGALLGLIRGDAVARDVSEQRFVTVLDEPITLRIALAAPTVTATHTIVTDAGEPGPAISDQPQCSRNSDTILLAEPRCNRDSLAPLATTASAVSTTAQWTVRVFEEASGEPLDSCITSDDVVECVLPAGSGAGYRVVTSVNRVGELWNGTSIGLQHQQGRDFLGHVFTARYCEHYTLIGGNAYCATRYEYQRPRGLDAATLTFGPIAVTLTANEEVYGEPLTGVVWTAGAEDFPGSTY